MYFLKAAVEKRLLYFLGIVVGSLSHWVIRSLALNNVLAMLQVHRETLPGKGR